MSKEKIYNYKEYLSNMISEYDNIFLIHEGCEKIAEFYDNNIESDKKILILTPEKCEYNAKKITVQSISADCEKKITELYHTYEFSDNFTIIDDVNNTVPSLYGFVKSGIISKEEMYIVMFA